MRIQAASARPQTIEGATNAFRRAFRIAKPQDNLSSSGIIGCGEDLESAAAYQPVLEGIFRQANQGGRGPRSEPLVEIDQGRSLVNVRKPYGERFSLRFIQARIHVLDRALDLLGRGRRTGAEQSEGTGNDGTSHGIAVSGFAASTEA